MGRADSDDAETAAAPPRSRGGGDQLPVLRRLSDVAELIAARNDTVYLRYSHGPDRDLEGGRSRDYEADIDMPGLSVSTVAPEDWWPRPAEEWIARRIRQYADLGAEQDRYPWLLTGRVAGFGPDHEPLLTDIEPLARLDSEILAEAARLYRRRFRVGRDSTERNS